MSAVRFQKVWERIGNIVEKGHDEFHWEIEDFFSAVEDWRLFESPRFSFMETPWCLKLILRFPTKPEFMGLFTNKMEHFERSVEYNVGLKKRNGVVEHFGKGIFGKFQLFKFDFIHFLELQQRKSELVPSDKLIIVFTLKLWESPKINKLIISELDVLSENLKDLFANKDSCDTILQVQDREFKAHKAILMARSPVFAAMFQHDTLEKQTGFVKIPDCNPESFQEFLDYLYCSKLEGISFRSAFQLYITSNKYDVQKLKEHCVEYLIENLTVDNVCDIIKMADKYDDEKLMPAAQVLFNKNWRKIFVTTEWKSLLKNDYQLVDKLLVDLSKAKGSRSRLI